MEGAAREVVGSPALEVFRGKTGRGTQYQGPVSTVVIGHALDWMGSEVFSNRTDPVLP